VLTLKSALDTTATASPQDPESKFGLWEEEVIQAYAIAQRARVERFGIHMHIGSGILDAEPYAGG
jgi:diaminopimelate decarboxylase